jgi:hypothetical protein
MFRPNLDIPGHPQGNNLYIPEGTKAFTFPAVVETGSGQIPITSIVKALVHSSMMVTLKMARTGRNM